MELTVFSAETKSDKFFRLIASPVSAGQPQHVEDTFDSIDLNEYVSGGSDEIFYIRVQGDSMIEYDILEGDLLVADRRRLPKNGDVVIAEINGSFTVKRFAQWQRNFYLVPENGEYKTRKIEEDENFAVWGVVTHVLHRI